MNGKGLRLAGGLSSYSNYSFAVTGLYYFNANAVDIASSLKPSVRGRLELTNFNRIYLQQGQLKVEVIGRGMARSSPIRHQRGEASMTQISFRRQSDLA